MEVGRQKRCDHNLAAAVNLVGCRLAVVLISLLPFLAAAQLSHEQTTVFPAAAVNTKGQRACAFCFIIERISWPPFTSAHCQH